MIEICADSMTHPLALIFQNSFAASIFVNDWEKQTVFPSSKKMINKLFQILQKINFNEHCLFCEEKLEAFAKV